jgi:pSer/pThr/pTyr-binding forkhead associated (FHA) protein
MPPADQPEEPAPQVFSTVETPAPSMLEGATRLASNWCLVFVSGPSPVSTVVLGKKVSFGRSAENDIAILDPLVSRQHAVVELSGGGYLVTDLASANGTFVNDAPVTTPTRLRVGDQVKFGGTVFRFQPLYEMK